MKATNKERVEISVLRGSNGIGLAVNNCRVTDSKLYGTLSPIYTYNVEKSKILEALGIKSDSEKAHWINEPGKIPKCSNCGAYSDDALRGVLKDDLYEDGTTEFEPIHFCPCCGKPMEEE